MAPVLKHLRQRETAVLEAFHSKESMTFAVRIGEEMNTTANTSSYCTRNTHRRIEESVIKDMAPWYPTTPQGMYVLFRPSTAHDAKHSVRA